MSRKIKILLDQRAVEDSPIILEKLSISFPNDDLELDITKSIENNNQKGSDEILKIKTCVAAQDALDENNRSVVTGEKKVPKEDPTEKNKEWLEEVRKEGVKVTVRTVLKSVIDAIMGLM